LASLYELNLSGSMNSWSRMSPGCTDRSFLVAISASMVIDDFHLERVSIRPLKADAPPLVDADAVLTLAVTLKSFELTGNVSKIATDPPAFKNRDGAVSTLYRHSSRSKPGSPNEPSR
jgi:hypothetical protein